MFIKVIVGFEVPLYNHRTSPSSSLETVLCREITILSGILSFVLEQHRLNLQPGHVNKVDNWIQIYIGPRRVWRRGVLKHKSLQEA
jgi:hypothetical protein